MVNNTKAIIDSINELDEGFNANTIILNVLPLYHSMFSILAMTGFVRFKPVFNLFLQVPVIVIVPSICVQWCFPHGLLAKGDSYLSIARV